MPFSTVFQLYHDSQCTNPCFPRVLLTSNPRNIPHRLLSHITLVEITDSGERGMNPVAMTIINPQKEYWPSRGSNQRPPVLKYTMVSTELWGSALIKKEQTRHKFYHLVNTLNHATIISISPAFKYYELSNFLMYINSIESIIYWHLFKSKF